MLVKEISACEAPFPLLFSSIAPSCVHGEYIVLPFPLEDASPVYSKLSLNMCARRDLTESHLTDTPYFFILLKQFNHHLSSFQ